MDPPANVKTQLRESYNAMAPEYNTWTKRHDHIRLEYLTQLLAATPKLASPARADEKPQQVLELGCGSGDPFLTQLLERVPTAHAHANELSDAQLDLARGNLAPYSGRTNFYPGDMTALEFEPGSLTAVVGLYTIIHLAQDEQEAMLKKIATWLAPGGTLLANFSIEESSGVTEKKWLHEKGWMFWSGLGKEKTLAAIQGNGLNVVQAKVEGDSEETFVWIIAQKPLP
jgi:ubiquinone/menaquinone biosynthesis C-methylase UbiE